MFEQIYYDNLYTVVISGLGITTQIPPTLNNIDIGLPYNVTGTDIPYKNNTNISIQSAFESLDATSQIPRIESIESDIEIVQDDIIQLQYDTTNLYELIGGVDTTSALTPRIESLETTTELQQDDIDELNVEVSNIKTDTTSIHLSIDNIKTDTTSIHLSIDSINTDTTSNTTDIIRIDNFLTSFSPDKVIVSDSDGTIIPSIITKIELEALDNITGNIQNQIDSIPDIDVFDPNDGTVGQLLAIASDGTNNIIIPYTLPEMSSNGVDYYFLRGRLAQHNSVLSGKAFFGTIDIDPDTGVRTALSTSIYSGTNVITIADRVVRASSTKISTGVYKIQFQTDLGSGMGDGFVELLSGVNYNKFESKPIPIWSSRIVTFNEETEQYDVTYNNTLAGYLWLDIVESANAFYYSNGQLLFKTFDSSGNLADNILDIAPTIEIRAFNLNS